MILTFGCLFALLASIGNGSEELTVVLAIGMVLTAGLAHLWLALSIRCPSCRRRVGWFVLATAGKQWLAQLWRGESCPACGNSPAQERH